EFGARALFFQAPEKGDELGPVVTMLQLAIAAHVQVANEVVPLWHLLSPLPYRASFSLSALHGRLSATKHRVTSLMHLIAAHALTCGSARYALLMVTTPA